MSTVADILSELRRVLALAVRNRERLFASFFHSQPSPAEILPVRAFGTCVWNAACARTVLCVCVGHHGE